jgi:chemotaxis protein methyltransferase CheR
MRPPLTDAEYRWLSDWLAEEYGLVFGPEKRDILRSRLDPRRADLGFETFEELYFHLKFHPDRETERQRLIPHLTNNESYFFREADQLDAFRSEVLPELRRRVEARKEHSARILSAGCASGEEPYTLAILIRESGLFPPEWQITITGIDLDPAVLARAREGVYGQHAFRRIDPAIRQRYFTDCTDGQSQLVDAVRSMVRFDQVNLTDPSWPRRHGMEDIIFCRNVLIYFGEETTRKVVESFYDALRPGGYLFLGHAESLSRFPSRFQAVRRPGAIYYQRPEADHG